MSAAIVRHNSRRPIGDAPSHATHDADYVNACTKVIRPAGQLWERVADAGLNEAALTPEQWRRMSIVRNELGTRHPRRLFVRGPLAQHTAPGLNPWIDRAAAGIIRAGKRIK